MDFKELFIENVSFLGTFAKTKFDNVLYYSRMTAFGGNRFLMPKMANLIILCIIKSAVFSWQSAN